MTLPPVIRVFFAIDLSTLAKEKLGAFITTLKRKSQDPRDSLNKSENLHITLQFLAETHTEHLPELIANVRARIEGAVKSSQFEVWVLALVSQPISPACDRVRHHSSRRTGHFVASDR